MRSTFSNPKPSPPVEQREVDLLKHLFKLALHHDHALPVGRLPHVGQVVNAVAPLVDEQGGGLSVRRLDPVGEQVTLVRLQEVCVCVGGGAAQS